MRKSLLVLPVLAIFLATAVLLCNVGGVFAGSEAPPTPFAAAGVATENGRSDLVAETWRETGSKPIPCGYIPQYKK